MQILKSDFAKLLEDPAHTKTIERLSWMDVGTYSCFLIFAVYSAYFILIKHKKYKDLYLMTFYIFAILLAISRLCDMIATALILHDYEANYSLALDKTQLLAGNFCFYWYGFIGVFQIAQTIELGVDVKASALAITEAR